MKQVKAYKSHIHGSGLFIEEGASKGELVAFIKGNYSTVKRQLLHTPEDAIMNPDWVGVSMSMWINPDVPFKYINHSCNPSCGIKGKKSLYALKNLKSGDEITLDYSTIEANPHWKMHCSCGEKNCRKTIRSVAYLPLASFKKYYPFIPTAFKKFYINYRHLPSRLLRSSKKVIFS